MSFQNRSGAKKMTIMLTTLGKTKILSLALPVLDYISNKKALLFVNKHNCDLYEAFIHTILYIIFKRFSGIHMQFYGSIRKIQK